MTRVGRWGRRGLPAALAVLLVAAASCTRQPKPPEEVVVWQSWPAGVIQPLLARFEAENPGLKVRLRCLPSEGGRDTIDAAVASGRVPDLCALDGASLPAFLAAGTLSDWSAGVADQRDSLLGWEMCTVGDAIYGMPWMLDTRVLVYNKSLFERARLDPARPPATWSEMRRAAVAVQRLRGGVHGFGVNANDTGHLFRAFMPLAWGNGGGILTAGQDTVIFDSPANREALEFYLGLRAAGIIGMQDVLDREFLGGRLGLEIAGAALLSRLGREAPALRYGVALVPRPGRERGTHGSFAEGEVLVSFNASKRKAEALRLARFLARRDNMLALARAHDGWLPATLGADSLEEVRRDPDLLVAVRQLATASFPPSHPRWAGMEAVIEDEIEQALFDKKSAAQAVRDAGARLAELVGRR
jgi:multiple sugar transport system substrate-binding protein